MHIIMVWGQNRGTFLNRKVGGKRMYISPQYSNTGSDTYPYIYIVHRDICRHAYICMCIYYDDKT